MRAAIISIGLVGISQAKVFQCADRTVLSGIQTSTGSTQDTCCAPVTCATFTCAAGKTLDAIAAATGGFTGADVNANNCCKDSTCADLDLTDFEKYCAGFNMGYSTSKLLSTAKQSKDNCCTAWTATCNMATKFSLSGDLFACASGTVNDLSAGSLAASQTNCCMKAICSYASGNPTDQKPHTCPADKKSDPLGYLKEASDANCCVPFTPTCFEATNTGAKFTCPAGKVLKTDTLSMVKAASAENCCEDFKPTCGNSAEDGGRAGDIWQCGPGKVFDPISWNLPNPSSLVCCKEPTCSHHTGDVCQDLDPKKCPKDEVLDPAKASKQYAEGYHEYCCIESSKIVFSSAERAGASVLLLLLALLQ